MSGFVITLDAILALTIAGLLVAWSVNMVASKGMQRSDMLVEYGYDFLITAEKSGALGILSGGCEADENGTYPCTLPIRELVLASPESICMELEMHFQEGDLYYHADNYNDTMLSDREGADIKTGCLKAQYELEGKRPASFVRVSRVFTHEGRIWPVTMELWYGGWKE
jgi:hypothetical protein